MPQHLQFKGLTSAEVTASRNAHGSNVLTPPDGVPLWRRFLAKFNEPLIIVLLVAGFLSIAIACYERWGLGQGAEVFFEPVGIFIAIFLATGLAFIFEYKADKEFALLNQVNDDEPVTVVRDGRVTEVPRRDIVVGDIVMVNAGQEVPADGKLLEAVMMSVDESSLTGEPMCHKTTDPAHFDPEATFPSDALMRGTKVMEGHGVMRVDAVGDATENGRVFKAAQIDDGTRTPLSEQLERLGHMISRIAYIVALAVVAGRIATYLVNAQFEWMEFLSYCLQTLMIAVTLVVVAVPEGLPMAVTLSLAYSMRRMLRTNNLVRKLHACETMGATTVICTDKTGTLTQNRMQVADFDIYDDADPAIVDESIAVNSTAQLETDASGRVQVIGNPTEGALLLWLRDHGADYAALRGAATTVAELPFTTERKYMATVVDSPAHGRMLYVKGAPEIVAAMCIAMPSDMRESIDRRLLGYQQKALRTLAFACRSLATGEEIPIDSAAGTLTPGALTFMAIAAIADPVRPDVPEAVSEVTDAGIKVKIVTGDTPATAREIGRQIGLWNDATDSAQTAIATGSDIAAMSDDELRRRIREIKIIARARPMDKRRLVEALQQNGEVVAVTGDGTNDAPALKAAQVGLSMGDGTSVAKEASDITIIDNSFASIGRAVMWGRSLYQNIRRFVLFQMTVNVVACIVVMAGSFMGLESPLTVTQMLWVNLIMDTFAAMALASLPPSQSVMKAAPRRRSDFIISRGMWVSIIGVGLTMTAVLLCLLYHFEHADVTSLLHPCGTPTGGTATLTPYELSLFFTIFVFLQFWNMFNARAFATGRSAFHLKDCRGFLIIALMIFVGQIAIVTLGGKFFSVVPLRLTDWAIIITGTSPVLLIGEALRAFHHKHPDTTNHG